MLNIDVIKAIADSEVSKKDELDNEKSITIKKYNEMTIIWNKCAEFWNRKYYDFQNKIIEEYKRFFKDNGFELNEENDKAYIATYKTEVFKLCISNDEEYRLNLYHNNDNYEFYIRTSENRPEYRYQNESLNVDGIELLNFNKDTSHTDFYMFLAQLQKIEQIKIIQEKIIKNIEFYFKGIQEINSTEMCIKLPDSNKEYKTFVELFNDL